MRGGPTLHHVARKAGVSKSTVSRVVNNHPHVSLVARETVLKVMAEIGYQPNGIARSLRTRATMTVGLIITQLRNEVFAAIGQGVDHRLSQFGRTLILGSSNGDSEREYKLIRNLLERGIDGLIVSLADERAQSVHAALAEAEVPIVLLDRDARGVAADRVLCDHRGGIAAALSDLQAHGHRTVGLLALPDYVRPGREVRAAFIAGGMSSELIRASLPTEEFGYNATRELLALRRRPTALIVSGTQTLVGVLSAISELEMTVPADLSLVAYDESPAARFHAPPISALIRDAELMGERAAELVMERIDGRRTQLRKIVVPTRYVQRSTVVAAPPRS
jgi:LacI family transcriptional regulator